MTLSIIVPIYNSEKYLEGLFQSLLPLSNDSAFEFIFVNDGSTDSSSDIIQHYLPYFKKQKYIYQENQGIAIARNVGVSHAKGDYIWYIDGDDEIYAPNVYEVKNQIDDSSDIIEFQYDTMVFGGG
jgi:glycosyltransferase involved in cell wall biosynthesis